MTTQTVETIVAQLQRRIARLLLHHDRNTFRGRFREIYAHSTQPQPELLQAYDRFTNLIALADELFDDIIPRIRRQMSFHATRVYLHEEPPLRGQIDWSRSLQRAWNDRPDQPPIQFTTTLRSKTFATPENRLVVAILQGYAQRLQQVRRVDPFVDAPLDEIEQREIVQLEDRVRRELGTPHFQELSREDEAAQIDDLIEQVGRRLRGGANSYTDLIAWWQRLEGRHLRIQSDDAPTVVLDAQEQAGLLYQLWIALELVDFLAQRQLLAKPSIRTDQLRFRFTWHGRDFRLVYDRQPKPHLAWKNAPGERPDYFITRADPLNVYDGSMLIWHEPGVLLDAKCYMGNEANRAAGAIKRMLADIQLVDATNGVLILPDITGLPEQVLPDTSRYLSHIPYQACLRLFDLRPLEDAQITHNQLEHLLDQVTAWLPERPLIACHGRWPDRDTRTPDSGDVPSNEVGEPLIFCPKPHIAPSRVDLVSPIHDCLKNPQLCHIMSGRTVSDLLPPFVQRVLSREDLQASIALLRQQVDDRFQSTDESDAAEMARTRLIDAIGGLVDSYRKLMRPNTRDIEEKLKWIFRAYWSDVTNSRRGLPEDVRNMLISGEFVWNEFQGSAVEDWAACAVQYVRAIERELFRRLYLRCRVQLTSRNGGQLSEHEFTFGTVKYAFDNRRYNTNWNAFIASGARASNADLRTFEAIVSDIVSLHHLRNAIAHSRSIEEAKATTVRTTTLGDADTGREGALPRFVALLDA